jgi:thiosulfate/3-mercaptopyruvate sulfurtransferase
MMHQKFLISAAELQNRTEDPEWRIVDCRFDLSRPERGYEEYRAGHIPGAAYAHLDRDLAGPVAATTGRHPLPQPELFMATLGRWGISRESRIVAYDDGNGAIAARLWWMLRWIGHSDVRVLDGGYKAWIRHGFEASRELPVFPSRDYRGRADPRTVIATDELQRQIDTHAAPTVLDARDADRFRGEREPIDAVAGHVPGARNLPLGRSLNDDGSWRSPAELEELWSAALPGGRDQPWIAMCGSGVTACHLALSAQLAGYAAPRLYVGSWSEWIRDHRRPVATGGEPGTVEPPAGRL